MLGSSEGLETSVSALNYLLDVCLYCQQSPAIRARLRDSPHKYSYLGWLWSSHGVAALAALLDEFRATLRIFSLFRLYATLRSSLRGLPDPVSGHSHPPDAFTRTVMIVQACAYLQFQLVDSILHLTKKGILPRSAVARTGGPDAWMRWGFRAWLVAVGMDLVRLGRETVLWYRKEAPYRDMDLGELRDVSRAWWAELHSSAAWLVVSLHLSLSTGLPGMNLGVTGLASLIGEWQFLRSAWDATR